MAKRRILFSCVHRVGKGYFIIGNIKNNNDIICLNAIGYRYDEFLEIIDTMKE